MCYITLSDSYQLGPVPASRLFRLVFESPERNTFWLFEACLFLEFGRLNCRLDVALLALGILLHHWLGLLQWVYHHLLVFLLRLLQLLRNLLNRLDLSVLKALFSPVDLLVFSVVTGHRWAVLQDGLLGLQAKPRNSLEYTCIYLIADLWGNLDNFEATKAHERAWASASLHYFFLLLRAYYLLNLFDEPSNFSVVGVEVLVLC